MFNPTLNISGLNALRKTAQATTTAAPSTSKQSTPASAGEATALGLVPAPAPSSGSASASKNESSLVGPVAQSTTVITSKGTSDASKPKQSSPAAAAGAVEKTTPGPATAVATPKVPTSAAQPSAPSFSAQNGSRPSPDRVPLFLPRGRDTDEEEGYISSELSDVDQLASEDETAGPSSSKIKKSKQVIASTSTSKSAPKAQATAGTPSQVKKKRPAPSPSTSAAPASGSGSRSRIPPLPHYTTVRAKGQNSVTNPHKIIINPGVTDGDRSRWKTGNDLNPKVLVDGKLNYYEVQPITGSQHRNFRYGLGKSLSDKLNLVQTEGEIWVLENWPDDWQFTVHHTGRGEGKIRTDVYVHGSIHSPKFRTVNEITPHLVWLLMHGPNDNLRCQCKYCAKKKQTEVNAIEGLQSHHGGSARTSSVASSPAPHSGGPVKKKPKLDYEMLASTGFLADKTRKAAKSKPIASASTSASAPAPPKKKHREETKEERARRKKAATPSYSGTYVNKERDMDLSDGGKFRVGELVWVELPEPLVKSTATDEEGDSTMGDSTDKITHWIAIIGERSIRSDSTKEGDLVAGQPPSIKNTQTPTYRCKLLAVDTEITREEKHLRAWLTFPPPLGLLTVDRMTAQESVKLAWDGKEVQTPKLNQIKTVDLAITPFALASQMAAHVVADFALVERYKIDPSHIVSSSTIPTSEQIKRDALIARNYHYQSIWWGGERIWSGELVRIITDELPSKGLLPASKGASKRALFLKLAAIYKDSDTDQAMLSGQLYELRDLKEGETLEDGSPVERVKAVEFDSHMPAPPAGFVFRRRNAEGDSVQLDAEYLAGRYYQLPEQWRDRETIDRVVAEMGEEQEVMGDNADLTEQKRAIAVAGLTHARVLYMSCATWVTDRITTIVQAEKKAQEEMARWFLDNSSSSSSSSASSSSHGQVNGSPAVSNHSH